MPTSTPICSCSGLHPGRRSRRRSFPGGSASNHFTPPGEVDRPCVTDLKYEHLHIPNVGQRTELLLSSVGHELIDAHNSNGILPCGLTAQVESGGIDLGFRPDCA